jgi:hypothetical protein
MKSLLIIISICAGIASLIFFIYAARMTYKASGSSTNLITKI